VQTDTDGEERTRLGRSDLYMQSERGGFMPDRANNKGEKMAGTPQAVWARQICADTELTTRGRVAETPQSDLILTLHFVSPSLNL
jgi:hypothetical protein